MPAVNGQADKSDVFLKEDLAQGTRREGILEKSEYKKYN